MLLLLACSDADNEGEEASSLHSIEFTTQLDTRAGRTYVSGADFVRTSRIGVFAYYTGASAFDGTTIPNFMYNQAVEKQSVSAVLLWAYSPVKYWPNQDGDKLTFCAYYPHDGTGIGMTSNTTAGLPRFTFQVQEASRDEVDFMLSDVRTDLMHINGETVSSVSSTVLLTFHHALSKVVVKVVDADDNELPFTATLSDMYDNGECYSTTSEPVNWENVAKTSPAITFTTSGATSANERIFLMIPQGLRGAGDDPCLRLFYEFEGGYYQSGAIHLNTIDAITTWEPGKTYLYTYHVTHAGNDLSVSVNPWYQAGMVFNNY